MIDKTKILKKLKKFADYYGPVKKQCDEQTKGIFNCTGCFWQFITIGKKDCVLDCIVDWVEQHG